MTATTDPELDAAVRQLSSDYTIYQTTFKVLQDVHKHEEGMCATCGAEYPCKTIRVLDNAQVMLDLSPFSG